MQLFINSSNSNINNHNSCGNRSSNKLDYVASPHASKPQVWKVERKTGGKQAWILTGKSSILFPEQEAVLLLASVPFCVLLGTQCRVERKHERY